MKRVFITMLAIVGAMMQMAVMAAQEPTQRRAQVKQYNELEFGLPVNARVVYDRQKAGLIEYMATDEAQKHIKMECVGGRLVCSYAKGWSSRSSRNESRNALDCMVIYTYGSLSEVKVKGLGSVNLDENILNQQPRLVVAGIGSITSSTVRTTSLDVEVTGTGLVKIEDLKLNADGCLNVDNRGVGRIYIGVSGSMANCTVTNAGTGKIALGDKFKANALSINNRGTGAIKIVGATVTNIALDMAGVGTVRVDGLRADCCNVQSAGSGRLIVTGQSELLTIMSSGAGKVNCLDLKAESVQVHSSGTGTVSVCKTDNLTVEKTGYGSVQVGSGDSQPITIKGNRVMIKNSGNSKK